MSEARGPRFGRRLRTHLALAAASLVLVFGLERVFDEGAGNTAFRFSAVTAWVCVLWLALTLLIGPFRTVRARRVPAHLDVRRDVGIWAGLFGIVHTVFALQVHAEGKIWLYFLEPHRTLGWVPSWSPAAVSNDLGLLAFLVVLGLLALSNDWALRWLGIRRWKQAQRLTYVLFVLTAAHGISAQLLERRHSGWVVLVAGLSVVTLTGQVLGYRARRRLSP